MHCPFPLVKVAKHSLIILPVGLIIRYFTKLGGADTTIVNLLLLEASKVYRWAYPSVPVFVPRIELLTGAVKLPLTGVPVAILLIGLECLISRSVSSCVHDRSRY